MKVRLELEIDVDPEDEITSRQEQNVVGMLQRFVNNRVQALVGRRLGGEKAETGWEVKVTSVSTNLISKVK